MPTEKYKNPNGRAAVIRNNLHRINSLLRPFRGKFAIALGFTFLGQAFSIFGPFINGQALDALVGRNGSMFFWYLGVAITAVVLKLVVNVAGDLYLLRNLEFAVKEEVGDWGLRKALRLSIGQHLHQSGGSIREALNRGDSAFTQMSFQITQQLIPAVTYGLASVIVLWLTNPILGWITMGGTLIFIVYTLWLNKYLYPRMKQAEDAWQENGQARGETIGNADLVIANDREDLSADEVLAKYHEAKDQDMPVWIKYNLLALPRELGFYGASVGVLATGGWLVLHGQMTIGTMTAALAWSGNAVNRFGAIGPIVRQMARNWVQIRKFFSVVETEPDVKLPENPKPVGRIDGRIEFREATFRYPVRASGENNGNGDSDSDEKPKQSEHPVLDKISFTIEPGETVAIIGESGSGKTTLAYTLLRARDPESGAILIDGQDLREIDLSAYRRQVGFVEQHVPLFDQTLRYNVTFGVEGEVPEERLSWALAASGVSLFLSKLEHGLETVIGERGVKLSGGQRQRVGIARALLKDPRILILDEATSSLDPETEAHIQTAIDTAAIGRTTIIIAHRLSTIKKAKKVVVLDRGRVAGIGSHSGLHKSSEPYRRLVRHQIDIVK